MKAFALSTIAILAGVASAASPAEFRQVSGIYEVATDRFALANLSTTQPCNLTAETYCGGTWQGLINNLDYIQGMGLDTVWISPVPTNTPNGYHGYWTLDLYTVNSYYGTPQDLGNLSKALHDRNMYLMVDVVVNDMGLAGTDADVDYAAYTPFNDQSYFHTECNIDYNNQTSVNDCWLEGLPDLRTEDPDVYNVFNSWISDLVANYSIDALRIDAVKSIDKPFFPPFVNASGGIYSMGENYDGDPVYTCGYQEGVMPGLENFPVYFPLVRALQATNGSFADLVALQAEVAANCQDPTLLTNFAENADVPRFASYTSDESLQKNALTYVFMADGIPYIYYGQEQQFNGAADPYNREALWTSNYNTKAPLYQYISILTKMRKSVISATPTYTTSLTKMLYNDTNYLAMLKGVTGNQVLTVLTNVGAGGANNTINVSGTGYTTGESLTDVISCETTAANTNGDLAIPISGGMPRVFYPTSKLGGSGLCGNALANTTTGNNPSSTGSTASHSPTGASSQTSMSFSILSAAFLVGLGMLLL
ncbi:MAG: hypothetical protein MMC33_004406 [Icmadophila ericetorum]|nr:hypothetical protein [Icmadophila ericetorum]